MFVVVRVHRNHGGELSDKLIVLNMVVSHMRAMWSGGTPEVGMDVLFINPIGGGWSGGTILHIFDDEANEELDAGLKVPSV